VYPTARARGLAGRFRNVGDGQCGRRCPKVVSLARLSPSPTPIPRGDRRRGLSDRSVGSWLGICCYKFGQGGDDTRSAHERGSICRRRANPFADRTLSELHVAPAVTNSREDFQFQGDAYAKRTNSAPRMLIRGAFGQIVDPRRRSIRRSTQCPAIRRPSALRCPLQCDRQPLDRCSANTRTRAPGLARSLRP
jgi:hypothetical protein